MTKKDIKVEVITVSADDHDDLEFDVNWVVITFFSDCFKMDCQNSMTEEYFFSRYYGSKVIVDSLNGE